MSERFLGIISPRTVTAGVTAAGLALGGSTACTEGSPEIARGEAHFSVECPAGSQPGIIEVADSGSMPIDRGSGRTAQAVVRITCLGEGGWSAPEVVQDENGGTCLGYAPEEHHLTVEAEQRETKREPQFFARDFDPITDIGITGVEQAKDWAIVTGASLHQHDLEDPYWKQQFKADSC